MVCIDQTLMWTKWKRAIGRSKFGKTQGSGTGMLDYCEPIVNNYLLDMLDYCSMLALHIKI